MKRLALVAAMLAAGCSQGVNVDNGNPSGTVAGIVLDASNEQPIGGATVTVVAGDKTEMATTDMNGQFAVGHVPAGTFIMSIAQMGYVTAQLTGTLSGAVGNFPVSNPQLTVGPVGLFPGGGSFTVRVADADGNPVASLKLSARTHVRQVIWDDGEPVAMGSYELSATTGADGSATFTGLPIYAALANLTVDIADLDVSVPPTKIMGTEIYDFLGLIQTFHLAALGSSAQAINLPGPNTVLAIVDSNIDYLKGRSGSGSPPFAAPVGSLIPINGPISISFNQAIDPGSLRTQFLDADGKLLATNAMAMVNVNLVQITPSTPLPSGRRFNLILHATPATSAGVAGTSELNVTAPFFTTPPAGANVTVVPNSAVIKPPAGGTGNSTLSFELSEPIGLGYGLNGTGNSGLIDCVAFYEISGSSGFNNDANTPFQADWKTTPTTTPPTNLVCRQPTGGVGQPGMNVTPIYPQESNNSTTNPTVVTGFTSRFNVIIGVTPTTSGYGPCVVQATAPNPLPGCTTPASGTKVHLIFSRQDSTTTVKRVDGSPVPDNIIVTIP